MLLESLPHSRGIVTRGHGTAPRPLVRVLHDKMVAQSIDAAILARTPWCWTHKDVGFRMDVLHVLHPVTPRRERDIAPRVRTHIRAHKNRVWIRMGIQEGGRRWRQMGRYREWWHRARRWAWHWTGLPHKLICVTHKGFLQGNGNGDVPPWMLVRHTQQMGLVHPFEMRS